MRKLLMIIFACCVLGVQAQKITRAETIRTTELGNQKMQVVDSTFVLVLKSGVQPITIVLGKKEKALQILRFLYEADVRKGDIIVLDRGWWDSKGCNVEKFTAETYGVQIWEIDQFDEIKLFGI